jgi:hypothetical protein
MSDIKLFESKKVRTQWDEKKELWFFSVIDVIEALTGTDRPRKYWNDLKTKLKKEGSELSENIGQLKMMSSDGKFYQTDFANTAVMKGLLPDVYRKQIHNSVAQIRQVATFYTLTLVDHHFFAGNFSFSTGMFKTYNHFNITSQQLDKAF